MCVNGISSCHPRRGFIISETCSMPFMYNTKSNGPNIDPCGTPQEI